MVEGPGALFRPFITMEDLLDKLKLLDYDIQFVAELRMRPLTRHYFVLQTNPGEQFFMFTSLAAWLVGINKYFMSCKKYFICCMTNILCCTKIFLFKCCTSTSNR